MYNDVPYYTPLNHFTSKDQITNGSLTQNDAFYLQKLLGFPDWLLLSSTDGELTVPCPNRPLHPRYCKPYPPMAGAPPITTLGQPSDNPTTRAHRISTMQTQSNVITTSSCTHQSQALSP